LLAEKSIRANGVAPGRIWTPLIQSTMKPEQVKNFGSQVPMKRSGLPAELAAAYVMLGSDVSKLYLRRDYRGDGWQADHLGGGVGNPAWSGHAARAKLVLSR
jgi:NAD(P)-dependent dehydrogenase (short-subunit alcohol dehydrogenase family)